MRCDSGPLGRRPETDFYFASDSCTESLGYLGVKTVAAARIRWASVARLVTNPDPVQGSKFGRAQLIKLLEYCMR